MLCGRGLLLSVGVIVLRVRERALPRLLAIHGGVFFLLGAALTTSSVRWALFAPAGSPFRYAPGLVLVVMTYSALLIGSFGPWQQRSRRVRVLGVWLGVFLELAILCSLLVRVSK